MSSQNRPLKVFLSYSHSDSSAVRSLYQRLSRDGVDVWLDKERLLAGQQWELEIQKAVTSSDVVLVCLSKSFNETGFRQKEVRIALEIAAAQPEERVFIIPVRLEEGIPPEFLSRYHWVDIFKPNGYETLLKSLRFRAKQIGLSQEAIKQEKTSWLFIYENIKNARNLIEISILSGSFPRLPRDLDDFQRSFIIGIESVSQCAQAAVQSETNYNRRQQLENALHSTEELINYVESTPDWQTPSDIKITLKRWVNIFEDELSKTQKRESIPNIYIAGMPLDEKSDVFKGRKDIIRILEREIITEAKQRPALLLFGARRTGKTSVLRQFPEALGPNVIPVIIDLQGLAITNSIVTFFEKLSEEIRKNILTLRRIEVQEISRQHLETDPYMVFVEWVKLVEKTIGNKWLLLCLDEYEYIQKMVANNRADERIFQLLRTLVQNHPKLTLLFSGAHTFDELDPTWSHYLINVHAIKIGDLENNDALELIEKPTKLFPLKYNKDAVKRILSAAGGQPYILQVICRDLVNLMNDENRLYATESDVNRTLDSALISGSAYFKEVWMGPDSNDARRSIMATIAKKRGVPVSWKILQKVSTPYDIGFLIDHDIIKEVSDGYCFKVELVRRWIEKRV